MKTLYLECNMGAAGDMINAALYGICSPEQKKTYLDTMNHLSERLSIVMEDVTNSTIAGHHLRVLMKDEQGHIVEEHVHDHHDEHAHHEEHDYHGEHDHHDEHAHHDEHDHHDHTHAHDHEPGHHHAHHHHSLADIYDMVEHFDVSDAVRNRVRKIYDDLAQAESQAHGRTVEEVHFHEVGAMDAVADITGACLLMELLAPERVVVSAINLGSGSVHTAHGILPVPTPATAYLLKGIPAYMSEINGELCTPTGAALLKSFATEYGSMPGMCLSGIGYGMGTKEFPRLNCVRALLGETKEDTYGPNGVVTKLSANVDDMTGEEVGFCIEKLLSMGALDVYATPIYMKKNRPAYEINVLCKPEDADILAQGMLKHTSTFGVRRENLDRYRMEVSFEEVETPYGIVRKKTATGYGISKSKYEYADLARLAEQEDCSLRELTTSVLPV